MPISWGRDGPAAIQANRDAIIQRAREAAEHAAHLKEELSKLDDSIALSRDVQRRAKAEVRVLPFPQPRRTPVRLAHQHPAFLSRPEAPRRCAARPPWAA